MDIQGFELVDDQTLASIGRWLRFAFGLCTILAAIGTVLASPTILLLLSLISFGGALSPVHPFDRIYNRWIRRFTGTGPLPQRGAPNRFACGLGTVWLVATAASFYYGYSILGYVLGGSLVIIAGLVSTIDFCIPSMIYRTIFGFPPKRKSSESSAATED
jgi:hypothetical protein